MKSNYRDGPVGHKNNVDCKSTKGKKGDLLWFEPSSHASFSTMKTITVTQCVRGLIKIYIYHCVYLFTTYNYSNYGKYSHTKTKTKKEVRLGFEPKTFCV